MLLVLRSAGMDRNATLKVLVVRFSELDPVVVESVFCSSQFNYVTSVQALTQLYEKVRSSRSEVGASSTSVPGTSDKRDGQSAAPRAGRADWGGKYVVGDGAGDDAAAPGGKGVAAKQNATLAAPVPWNPLNSLRARSEALATAQQAQSAGKTVKLRDRTSVLRTATTASTREGVSGHLHAHNQDDQPTL